MYDELYILKQGWSFGRPKLVLDRTGGFYRPKVSKTKYLEKKIVFSNALLGAINN